MKQLGIGLVLAALFASAGCFTTGGAKEAPLPVPAYAATPPPVTPEQLTPQNAREMVQRLEEEMNRAQRELLASSAP